MCYTKQTGDKNPGKYPIAASDVAKMVSRTSNFEDVCNGN
jgi:hypothetical protein